VSVENLFNIKLLHQIFHPQYKAFISNRRFERKRYLFGIVGLFLTLLASCSQINEPELDAQAPPSTCTITLAKSWRGATLLGSSTGVALSSDLGSPRLAPHVAVSTNVVIEFESTLRRGRETEVAHGGKRPGWNGDSTRLFVRKAQYHYGWDWGPVVLCLGPWRDVYVESYETRIADVLTTTKLSADFSQAELDVAVTLEGAASDVTLELYSPDGTLLESQTLYSKQNKGLQKSLQQQVSSGHLRHNKNGMLPLLKTLPLFPQRVAMFAAPSSSSTRNSGIRTVTAHNHFTNSP
jgi:hypothetical protein